MKKQTLLQECLLSAAAVIAAPGLCLAADHAPLHPVHADSSLRVVPDAAASIITLVQHDTSSENRNEAKKPGFFRRLFGKRADDSASTTQVSPGQPGVQIPKPPPIDFTMPGQSPKYSNGVPSKSASFSNSILPTYQAAHSKASSQPAMPVDQQQGHAAAKPQNSSGRPLAPHDGFVSPFVSEELPQRSDTLLDLDSLIQGQQQNTAGPQDVTDSDPQVAEQLIHATDDSMRVVPAQKRPVTATAELPEAFDGYQLPADDEVLDLPETVAPTLPEATVEIDAKADFNSIVQVPLLEEPAMTLPTVAASRPEPNFQLPDQDAAFSEPDQIAPAKRQSADAFHAAEASSQDAQAPSFVEQPGELTTTLRVMDSRARREQQRYRIMARTDKAGFKGFCPVALRDDRELLDSREQFKAKFGLQTYYFSSAKTKSTFESDPVRYAPAGGGSDVVLLVNTGEETPGSLDFCLWYRDRLYMFRSRETQAMFSKDPRRYADQY